ncbi:MAG: DNA polymerase III subunit beta, partial [Clostridia bacterium]|nr:DNA polymerase III subunit beta [Clostridia bacterium]
MELSCQQADLLQALDLCGHAMQAKSPHMVLDSIYLRAQEGGEVTLTCTDLKLTITASVPAFFDGNADILLPKLFADIIRRLPDGEVRITISSTLLVTIRCQSIEMTVQGMITEGYPAVAAPIEGAGSIVIKSGTFKNMIRQTSFAVSQDEMRQILTGCLLECEGDTATMVSLDNFRMAIRKEKLVKGTDKPVKLVIPGKYLSEIGKILSDTQDEITISYTSTQVYMAFAGAKILVRLLDGNYMNYKQIIPQNNAISVRMERSSLLRCVERAMLVALGGKTNLIKMELKLGEITITSNSDISNIHEVIEAQVEGGEMTTAFNVRYVYDVLRNLDDEYIYLRFNTAITPCVMTPSEGDSFTYLLMPVRFH